MALKLNAISKDEYMEYKHQEFVVTVSCQVGCQGVELRRLLVNCANCAGYLSNAPIAHLAYLTHNLTYNLTHNLIFLTSLNFRLSSNKPPNNAIKNLII